MPLPGIHREEFLARLQRLDMPAFSTEFRTLCRISFQTWKALQWKMGLMSNEEYCRPAVIYGRFNKGWARRKARGEAREGVLTRIRLTHDVLVRVKLAWCCWVGGGCFGGSS